QVRADVPAGREFARPPVVGSGSRSAVGRLPRHGRPVRRLVAQFASTAATCSLDGRCARFGGPTGHAWAAGRFGFGEMSGSLPAFFPRWKTRRGTAGGGAGVVAVGSRAPRTAGGGVAGWCRWHRVARSLAGAGPGHGVDRWSRVRGEWPTRRRPVPVPGR